MTSLPAGTVCTRHCNSSKDAYCGGGETECSTRVTLIVPRCMVATPTTALSGVVLDCIARGLQFGQNHIAPVIPF